MSDQLQRQLAILRSFPRPPGHITTAELHDRLSTDFPVSKRTLERDLLQLSDMFPEAVEAFGEQGSNRRTTYWRLRFRYGLLPESLLNDQDLAMALSLLEQQARTRLPCAVLERLAPYWEQAHATLAQSARTQRWQRDFQYLPDPLRPEPPSVSPDIQRTIEDALVNEQLLELEMNTLDGQVSFTHLIALRLLLQEEILYLIAENPDAETPETSLVQIPLHRVTHVVTRGLNLGGSGLEPDLAQQYLLGIGDTITLGMRVSRKVAEALFQRPIGRNQTIEPNGNHYRVTTVVEDSLQLRHWLKEYEGELEILQS